MPKLDPRLVPLVTELRSVVREKGKNYRGIDRELGWWDGQTSQLINGHADFRLTQLYDVLGALDVEPREFFARVGGVAPTSEMERRIERRLAEIEARLPESRS